MVKTKMKPAILFLSILAFCSTAAFGQATITSTATPTVTSSGTVPAASASVSGVIKFDNVTLGLNSTGQLSVIRSGASTWPPAGITFDGTTLTVPKLSTTQVSLTGGTNYPNGLYVASFTGGVITWIPLTASILPTGSAVIPAQTVTVPAQTVSVPAQTVPVTTP